MTPKQVIAHFGGRTEAANACGVSYQAVKGWEDKGKVPKLRQHHIQNLTSGELVAESDVEEDSAA